ncbi:MAG: antitoxin [Lachnospira sp.]|nr:antitoxin [Lachnospira sp.]
MNTAKIFENGRSQAVRLPKEYRFHEDEVFVNKIGDVVILVPKSVKWSGLKTGLEMFSDDYMADGRDSQSRQEREEL